MWYKVSSVTSNFAKWIGRLKPCDYGRTGYSSNTKPNTKTRPMKFDREMSVTHSSFALSSTVSHLIVTQTFLKHARTSSFFSQHRANGGVPTRAPGVFILADFRLDGVPFYRAKENLASAKIVKIEFNAYLHLLGFPFYNI